MDSRIEVTVRQASAEDLEAIIQIEAVCFPAAEAAGADDFHKRFRAFGENFFVAVSDGRVIGFINGCTTDRPVLQDELYHNERLHNPEGAYQTVFGLDVLPEYRRQGIAAQLMQYLIQTCRMRGKTGIVLTCKDRLLPYYEQFGYQWKGVSASSHGGAKWNDMVLML